MAATFLSRFRDWLRTHTPVIRWTILVAVVLVSGVVIAFNVRLEQAMRTTMPPGPAAASAPLPASAASKQKVPGLLALPDFQIVVPNTWQRRQDWEDKGPGTKLFLLGPEIDKVQLVIGIDVYPLRQGTTLDQFISEYRARWSPLLAVNEKHVTLCRQPAELLAFTDQGLDKYFIMMTWRDKGYAIGMIFPTGHADKSLPAFRQVIDTFKVYK